MRKVVARYSMKNFLIKNELGGEFHQNIDMVYVNLQHAMRDPFNSTDQDGLRADMKEFLLSFAVVVKQSNRSFGVCSHTKQTIAMNSLFEMPYSNNPDAKDTFFHELAHAIQKRYFPVEKPHGRAWKAIMKVMGYNPRATVNDKNLNGKLRESAKINHNHLYTCENCGYEIRTTRKLKGTANGFLHPSRYHKGCGGIFLHERIA